jgi:hypothetical protein
VIPCPPLLGNFPGKILKFIASLTGMSPQKISLST